MLQPMADLNSECAADLVEKLSEVSTHLRGPDEREPSTDNQENCGMNAAVTANKPNGTGAPTEGLATNRLAPQRNSTAPPPPSRATRRWSYAVHVPEIDREHQGFGIIGSLQDAMRAGKGKQALGSLLADNDPLYGAALLP